MEFLISIAPESALEKAGCFCWFWGFACAGAGWLPDGCDCGAPLGDAELDVAGVGDEAFPEPELTEDDEETGELLPPAGLDDVGDVEDGGALDGADALVSLALVLASELLAES